MMEPETPQRDVRTVISRVQRECEHSSDLVLSPILMVLLQAPV